MVASAYAHGVAAAISDVPTYAFISAPVTINVTDPSQIVHVSSSAALGNFGVDGATDLRLAICQGQAGVLADNGGDFILGVTAPPSSRQVYSLTTRFTGLAAGTYEFGLCGFAEGAAAGWNNNEWTRTTAILAQQ